MILFRKAKGWEKLGKLPQEERLLIELSSSM